MDALVQSLCFFCAVVIGAPEPALPRGADDIWFSKEAIGAHEYLLRLSTTDLIVDTQSSRQARLDAFAQRLAEEVCPNRFELSEAERSSWPRAFPHYAKQYLVRCR
jgi:hypothetical protein